MSTEKLSAVSAQLLGKKRVSYFEFMFSVAES